MRIRGVSESPRRLRARIVTRKLMRHGRPHEEDERGGFLGAGVATLHSAIVASDRGSV